MIAGFYSPLRIWKVFRVLLTLYLLIRKREHILLMHPLSASLLLKHITDLGASFIKLAQVLATRSDFFPPAYLEALKTLHDELPPMPQVQMERVFKAAFATDHPFAHFDHVPIASASIGQVHSARLHSGEKVAVKLRRKGIAEQVNADVRILSAFNRLFRPLFSPYTKHSIESVIREFSAMIVKEVSLNHERANLEKFIQAYADSGILFPIPYPSLSSDDALVMQFMEGFRFDDTESVRAHDLYIHALIERLVTFYTEQMLVRGFFHADPHPGNLLITPTGELCLLDFGMVKRIPNETRIAIIELIKAANERDYERYVSAAKRLGTVAYDAPSGALAEFTEQMFSIFENDALDSASMQQLAFDVLDKTRNLPFKLPQEAIYILRVSAIIEGLGTTYIENFNGIKDILPILQRNIPRALGAKSSIVQTLLDEVSNLPLDLRAIRTTFVKASEGDLSVQLSSAQLEVIQERMQSAIRPVASGIILMLGAIFLLLCCPQYMTGAVILFTAGAARIWFR